MESFIRHLQLVPSEPPSAGEKIAALADAELRLLAAAVGDHLPVEVAERVAQLRAERTRLERDQSPPQAL